MLLLALVVAVVCGDAVAASTVDGVVLWVVEEEGQRAEHAAGGGGCHDPTLHLRGDDGVVRHIVADGGVSGGVTNVLHGERVSWQLEERGDGKWERRGSSGSSSAMHDSDAQHRRAMQAVDGLETALVLRLAFNSGAASPTYCDEKCAQVGGCGVPCCRHD